MDISTLTPLLPVPSLHEMSSMRSKRDSDSVQRQWQRNNDVIRQVNQLSQVVNQMAREIKKLEGQNRLDLEMFPFKIYTVPTLLRPTQNILEYTSSINWRTVRVRGGLVLNQVAQSSSFVQGCDKMHDYSYTNMLPPSVGTYDIQVPSGSNQYWFWIEANTGSYGSDPTPYYLRHSSNPTSASIPNNPYPWTNWPSSSSENSSSTYYYPIGWCDTNSSGSQNQMFTRQFLNADIESSPSTGNTGFAVNRGTFSSTVAYNFGDIVTIGVGSSQGSYWSTLANNINNYPSSGVGWVSISGNNNWY